MQFSPPLAEARLLRRYKRFLADVQLPDGSEMTLHCPNTGSMLHCGSPGDRVWYSTSDNPRRKYAHTWELVEVTSGALICINTARANLLVAEALSSATLTPLSGYESVQREARFGEERSRVDFLLRHHPHQPDAYVEVKSVTLGMGNGRGLFPDAVTARGARHLRELMRMRERGYRAVLLFCVMHSGIESVAAAREIDPVYAETLELALAAGVEVFAWKARVGVEGLWLEQPLVVLV